jgi:hypothetical protein
MPVVQQIAKALTMTLSVRLGTQHAIALKAVSTSTTPVLKETTCMHVGCHP